jgi:hypothetical protein
MSANLLTLLGNITLDAGGCPHPFISESLHPYTQGCKFLHLLPLYLQSIH